MTPPFSPIEPDAGSRTDSSRSLERSLPFGPSDPAASPGPGPAGIGLPSFIASTPPPKHNASTLTQLLAFILCSVALAALAFATSTADVVTFGVVALGVGVAIGLALDLTRFFRAMPGAVAGLLVMVALFVLWAVVESQSRGSFVNPAPLALAGVVVLAMDWRWIERLRPLIAISGLLVIPAMGSKAWAALPFALAWFALALAAYWSCERDLVRESPRLQPIAGGAPTRPINTTADLVRTAAIALVVGLGLALMVGNPSCSQSSPPPSAASRSGTGAGGAGGPGGPGGVGGVSGAGGAGRSGGAGRQSGPVLLDRNGNPIDRNGNPIEPGNGRGSGSGSRRGSGGVDGSELGSNGGIDSAGRSGRPDGVGSGGGGSGTGGSGADGSGGGNGADIGGGARTDPNGSTTGQPTGRTDSRSPWDLRAIGLVALLVLVIAAILALAWPAIGRWLRAPVIRAQRSWAESFALRLEHEGAIRGRPRRRGETVLEYSRALTEETLPDVRITEAGQVLSASLFSSSVPSTDWQVWADSVLDEIAATHPPPTRRARAKAALT